MKKSILGCAIAGLLFNVGNAAAGGLWLNEYGDFSGGRASAGAPAGTDDAASIAHNPASATRLEGDQLFASGGAYLPDIKFDVDYTTPRLGSGNGGDAGEIAPAGSLAYVHDFGSEKWSGGVYFTGLSGAGLDYDKDWAGRYQATEVTLVIATLAPTVAYQLTDRLSIGASLQYWYGSLDLKLALPRLDKDREDFRGSIDGDDTGFAYTLGAMYELTERTRFGVLYQSELNAKFGGDLKIKSTDGIILPDPAVEVSVDTEMDMAQYVRLAMHHDLDERWGVNFTVGWDDWSALGNVFVSTENRGGGVPTKWRDTYHYAWGAEYQLDKYWALTAGVAYDTNPVDKENRNAQLPVDRQIRYAFGARYAVKDSLAVGGYVNYADLGRARISAANFGGEYQNNAALQLVLNASWKF